VAERETKEERVPEFEKRGMSRRLMVVPSVSDCKKGELNKKRLRQCGVGVTGRNEAAKSQPPPKNYLIETLLGNRKEGRGKVNGKNRRKVRKPPHSGEGGEGGRTRTPVPAPGEL